MTDPKPAAAVDLEALARVVRRGIGSDAQGACEDASAALSVLIAKLEQLRAALASVDGGADLPLLEACAELVASLDASGLTDALRRRVMLLADWQRVRKLPSPPEAVKP